MQQTCTQCSAPFDVTDDDLALLAKLSPKIGEKTFDLPAPTMCFTCRLQRRLMFHNESNLYHRTCDKTGKTIVSMYRPDSRVTVYDCDAWNSDDWNPLDYGKEFDFNRPFFDQFKELFEAVPQIALSVVKEYNQNSDFTNNNWKLKNCYLLTDAEECENCYYGKGVEFCRDCTDVLNVFESELCYQSLYCRKCYGLFYSQYCNNCHDSWFLRDCTGCRNCIACCNLHQKEYCIFNEQKTKEEYETFLASLKNASFSQLQQMEQKAIEFFQTQPVKAVRSYQTTNALGDNLTNAKDAHYCFDAKDIHNCRYLTRCTGGLKDSMDIHVWGTDGTELCLSGVVIGKAVQRTLFSYFVVQQCSDILYSQYCSRGCSHLFGCCGLRQKEYCIFNKQYTREEYEELVPRIIAHMQKTGEWGQYFPASVSPFGYNETDAQDYYPLTQEEVKSNGWHWNTYSAPVKADEVIPASHLPDSGKDIPEDILNWAIECEETGKPFKIIKQESGFYKTHDLPFPRLHPSVRSAKRFQKKNPYQLFARTCQKCSKDIQTSYSPDRKEIVWCEDCYLAEVY